MSSESMNLWVIGALVGVLALMMLLMVVRMLTKVKPLNVKGAHVVVTGGSSGIGKCIAKEALEQGAAYVTIIARNKEKLVSTKDELVKKYPMQNVNYLSLDLSSDAQHVETAMTQLEKNVACVDFLINCAGTSVSSKFEDTTIDNFRFMMETNFFGSLYITHAILPQMKKRKHGRVVFTSSMAGQLGLFGYTAYASSKFALRGLAESLQMEVAPFNIRVTLAFPPDTDTPGFELEQIGKPKETLLISESGGLVPAETVGKIILNDSVQGRFLSSVGFDGFMLSSLTSGFSPVGDIIDLFPQLLVLVPMRIAAFVKLLQFDHIVKKCLPMEEEKQKLM